MRTLFLLLGLAAVWGHLHQWRLKKEAQDALCERLSGQVVWLSGVTVPLGGDRYRLETQYQWGVFFSHPHPISGRVQIRGFLRCRVEARNPSRVADGLVSFARKRVEIHGPVRSLSGPTARSWFRESWVNRLQSFEGLRAVVIAVWLGDLSLLPKFWVELYRQGGLLHILALSGQHIALVIVLARIPFSISNLLLFRNYVYRRYLPWIRDGWILCSILCLGLVNPLNAPLWRAIGMWIAWRVLTWRRMTVSPVQLTTSCFAGAILTVPENFADCSFLLSAIAVFCLAHVLVEQPVNGRAYVRVSLWMPILLLPVLGFFFAKISCMAALNGLVLVGIWSIFWIPVGFLAGIAALSLPLGITDPIFALLETFWQSFAWVHHVSSRWIGAGYFSTVRPTVLEAILVLFALLEMMRHPLIFVRNNAEIEGSTS